MFQDIIVNEKLVLIFFIFSLSIQVKAEVTYLEILKNPTDLRLNLQYAKEQEALGEFKSVIATLERLTALYPTNIDLKLYLLSIAVKTDSTEKVLRLIDEIRQSMLEIYLAQALNFLLEVSSI